MIKVCHLEEIPPHSWLMRIGPENWVFGEPYEIVTVVVDIGEKVCEIRGLDKPITPDHWRAARKCLLEKGFEKTTFTRRKETGNKHKVLKIGEREGGVLTTTAPLRLQYDNPECHEKGELRGSS